MKRPIRNLARATTHSEPLALLEPYGAVQSCTLVVDTATGVSKGFGFVEIPVPGAARAAMKNLNGKEVAGSKIRGKKAEQKPGNQPSAR